MDSKTRYSAGLVCADTSLKKSNFSFTTTWLSPFWSSINVRGDQAFNHTEFKNFITSIGATFGPIPPRRHQKNVIESKHGIIRSIFIRLKADQPDADAATLAQKSIFISNNLYGSDIMSAYEMAHGFTRPLNGSVQKIGDDIIDAQNTLEAKRKLTKILRTKSTHDTIISAGDLVEIFIKIGKQKRGKWSSPRTVLNFDPESWTVTVPSSNGRTMKAAVEDVRLAVSEESFASLVREGNDRLDNSIEEMLDEIQINCVQERSNSEENSSSEINNDIYEYSDSMINFESHSNKECQHPSNFAESDSPIFPAVGDSIKVFWPLDNQYYNGTVANISDNNVFTISYDDGEVEELPDMSKENWRFSSSAMLHAMSATNLVVSNEGEILNQLLEYFGNKPFLRYRAQGFPTFPLLNAYNSGEEDFKKTVKTVPIDEVPKDANVISSHVIYKVKVNDDKSLKLKARIAPHGNEDSIKNELRSDCAMCPPLGVRIILSIATLFAWILTAIDVKTAFLQTGRAERDVYVIPPTESTDRGSKMWLLLCAAYGLINSNAKWQVQSDQELKDIGFQQIPVVPQLFMLRRNGKLVVVLAKFVDDILLTGVPEIVKEVIERFNKRFKLGNTCHGPNAMRYFGLNINQDTNLDISIDGDDKLKRLQPYEISRVRRKNMNEKLNQIEAKAFASINASIGWLGVTASPFCAQVSSHLQQHAPNATIKEMIQQINLLRKLKKVCTVATYKCPKPNASKKLSVLVFSDAGRTSDHGQLCFIAGLLVGELTEGSIFHSVSWSSRKSKRPVKSVGAAEILAAGEAIDEGKSI